MNTNDPNDMNPDPDGPGRDGFGCDAFAEQLSLFVFGELDDERRPALERHLVGCAACRGERDALQRSLELLRQDGGAAAAAPQLSPARQANLLAQARATVDAKRVGTRSPVANAPVRIAWRMAAAAAVVAAAGLATLVWNRNSKVCDQMQAPDSPDAVAAKLESERRAGDGTRERGSILTFAHSQADAPPAASAPTTYAGPSEAAPPDAAAASSRSMRSGDLRDLRQKTENEKVAETKDDLEETEVQERLRGLGYPASDPNATTPSAAPADSTTLSSYLSVARGAAGPATPSSKEVTDAAARQQLKELDGLGYIGEKQPDGSVTLTFGDGSSREFTPEEIQKLEASGCELKALGLASEGGETDSYLADAGAARALSATQIGQLLAMAETPAAIASLRGGLVAAAAKRAQPLPAADIEKARDEIVRSFLDRLARRQNEPPRDMFFRYFGDHPFVWTRIDPKSTFGMDVDTASYSLVRAYLTRGTLPPKGAVRTEEFVNAFRHDLPPPPADSRDVFAIHTEAAPSAFGEDGQLLLQIGLKAREIDRSARKPVALTFVIDVSGSMSQDGRLELVKRALHLLVDQLDERDSIGIVSFESTGHRILDPTCAANRARIDAALDSLHPEGSTNADQGLRLGYAMALEQRIRNGENRVILCSDGVANTGVTDPKWLSARIAECKSQYIYLNCVGVGMGNHNDALMEQLADEGDGFCAYVDRIEEAEKLFVEKLTGTLLTVARNAKIQVEFDPASVRRFRQLGYENRALAHRDFRNDKVDAGEVGAGQEVVALYELEPVKDATGPLGTVRIRYEDPDAGTVREQAREIFAAEVEPTFAKADARFRLSACVAEFAELLRQSVHARDGSFGAILQLATPLVSELAGDPDVGEFVALVQQAARLPDLIPARCELARCVDEIKRSRCLGEEMHDAKGAADDALMRQLEEQNRRLEQALRDALDRALRGS